MKQDLIIKIGGATCGLFFMAATGQAASISVNMNVNNSTQNVTIPYGVEISS